MVDREVLSQILQTLVEYIEELRGYRQLPRERLLAERQLQSALRYALQSAIQCVLDAGLHVLVDGGLARPRDNAEILRALGEHGIVPDEFARRIEGMAGFRNILVHRYAQVDSALVVDHLEQRLDDFERLLRCFREILDRPPRS